MKVGNFTIAERCVNLRGKFSQVLINAFKPIGVKGLDPQLEKAA